MTIPATIRISRNYSLDPNLEKNVPSQTCLEYDFNRTDITPCSQCKRVHSRKGDFCQECENHNALYTVKKVDD